MSAKQFNFQKFKSEINSIWNKLSNRFKSFDNALKPLSL